MSLPLFDVWVCQGRMCSARGADAVADRARAMAERAPARCRALRGGCYGLCEIGPNVVVRRHEESFPDPHVDRLSLTEEPNETVYAGVTPAELEAALSTHLDKDTATPALVREAREAQLPPSPVAARLRTLRALRNKRRQRS